jgi:pimeloyl-ACP methyl ester carboxylesterase
MKQTIRYRNGEQLSYAEYGDPEGFPILVQHGLIASIEDSGLFDAVIRHGARVICIARPGYGDSSPYGMSSFAEWATIAAALIRKLDLPHFDVLGISSGAPYSYALGWGCAGRARNLYIFSGVPALYDEQVRANWPYPPIPDQSIASLKNLARELFFSHLTQEDLKNRDIRDAMRNDCFGPAQDFRLRFLDWGFSLDQVKCPVFMRHSQSDDAVPYRCAARTAELLPDCRLDLLERGPHFSPEALAEFLEKTVVKNVRQGKNNQNAHPEE